MADEHIAPLRPRRTTPQMPSGSHTATTTTRTLQR